MDSAPTIEKESLISLNIIDYLCFCSIVFLLHRSSIHNPITAKTNSAAQFWNGFPSLVFGTLFAPSTLPFLENESANETSSSIIVVVVLLAPKTVPGVAILSTYSCIETVGTTTAGVSGDVGIVGDVGIIGAVGTTGSSITIGSDGSVGSTGSVGFVGSAGFVGSVGSVGSTGSVGSVGSAGSVGFVG